ncbi:MAG TPA: thioesterase family protein [Candidatus Aquabacterium excrementipullorum]|nr:thioesterase family protein [Candidatus Aquabacterium excrementipullorum]
MAGLFRNIIAFILGLLVYGRRSPGDTTTARFLITPFDVGMRILKSDKYLQLVEPAQMDFLLQVGRLFEPLRSGTRFVNLGQTVRFLKPIPVFSIVRIDTRIAYADDKCAFFASTLHVKGERAAEVLVKMKYKKRGVTVDPRSLLHVHFDTVPVSVQKWNEALAAL